MQNALIIFVRNSEKGKVKSRLAKVIGEDKALEVYKFLLRHTRDVTVSCKYSLFVFYSNYIHVNDVFDDDLFSKHKQEGNDLGERMLDAFKKVKETGAENICIIGSDCYELTTDILQNAFSKLAENQAVIGPSKDGGYYLLGLKKIDEDLFADKPWGTPSVLPKTLESIQALKLSSAQLVTLSDIDTMEDLLETNILTRLKEDDLQFL